MKRIARIIAGVVLVAAQVTILLLRHHPPLNVWAPQRQFPRTCPPGCFAGRFAGRDVAHLQRLAHEPSAEGSSGEITCKNGGDFGKQFVAKE